MAVGYWSWRSDEPVFKLGRGGETGRKLSRKIKRKDSSTRSSTRKSGKGDEVLIWAEVRVVRSFLKLGCAFLESWKTG
jgi:hypothetical protein